MCPVYSWLIHRQLPARDSHHSTVIAFLRGVCVTATKTRLCHQSPAMLYWTHEVWIQFYSVGPVSMDSAVLVIMMKCQPLEHLCWSEGTSLLHCNLQEYSAMVNIPGHPTATFTFLIHFTDPSSVQRRWNMQHFQKVYRVSHNSVTCKKTTINTAEQSDKSNKYKTPQKYNIWCVTCVSM